MTIRIYDGTWATHGVTTPLADRAVHVRTDCGLLVAVDLTRNVAAAFHQAVTCGDCRVEQLARDNELSSRAERYVGSWNPEVTL